MKRILYLSRGGQIAGSQRQLHYLMTNLNSGFEPVILFNKDGEFPEQIAKEGIPCSTYYLPPWRKFPKGILRYCYAESLVIKARKYDIALVHCSDLWLSGYMRWIAGRLSIPSVLHVRTPISVADVRKHGCAKATALIAISRQVRRSLLEANIAPKKISRIIDSVDLVHFHPLRGVLNVLRQQYQLTDCQVLVGMVGRIEAGKRQYEFIRAAEKVIRDVALNVTFVIIGSVHDVQYDEALKKYIAKRGLQDHVIFTGHRDDMPEVLNSLDLLVSLSGGSVMFEATACGVPVVVGYRENEDRGKVKFVKECPLLGNSGQKELIETITRLIQNASFRTDIGRKSRVWAKRRYGVQRMVEKTTNLYEKIISEDK